MKRTTQAGLLGVVGGLIWCGGCMTAGPDYQPPTPQAPTNWNAKVESGSVIQASDADALSHWWAVFNDPVLSALIEQARVGNMDVRQAEARLRKARAQRGMTTADRWPTLGANASTRRNRASDATGDFKTSSSYANGFDASWELDLFGAKRRAVESADATLQASRDDLNDVRVSLFAEVALNYVDYRSYQTRLAIAETNLATQTETYDIARWRQEANLVTVLDVDQAQVNLEQTRAQIPSLQSGLDQAEHQLAILLGQTPGSLKSRLQARQAVPVPTQELAVGVPADVLRRRPDVRRAERRLAAQTAQIGVAQAARYPNFTLSGSIGLEAIKSANLYDAAARTAQAAAQAGWTLFDGGKIRQNVAVQTALQEETLGAYEAAVLTALKDVEDALVAYANEQARRRALQDAALAGGRAFGLARYKYTAGLVDFQTVLDTQRSWSSAQDQLASSEATVTSNLIRLYKALGGGWNSLTPDADTTTQHDKGTRP